jgi:hypothetical protein
MVLREIEWSGIDWIELVQNRDHSCELDNELWVPSNSGKFLCSGTTDGFSRRDQLQGI